MTATTTVNGMGRVGHREAMEVGAVEYQRFIDLLRSLAPEDWSRPTECTLWDVRGVVAHNLGNLEANASMREMAHQMRTATKRAKANHTLMVDELTALQVSERIELTTEEIRQRVKQVAPRALAGRRKTPAILRRTVKISMPPPHGSLRLGFLIDQIYNRDMWMHRIDICRATGREMATDAEHDGRILAEIVGDWADNHGKPFELVLDGPAGGAFRRGDGGERLRLDAVEFARIVSGRHDASVSGLLKTEVLY